MPLPEFQWTHKKWSDPGEKQQADKAAGRHIVKTDGVGALGLALAWRANTAQREESEQGKSSPTHLEGCWKMGMGSEESYRND